MFDKHPIIIHVVCHDLGRHSEVYGRPVKTPRLQEFAQDSLVFDNAFCTSPACSPSRGCVMTGQYAHQNGMIGLSHLGWGLRPERQTIVDYFNSAGTMTAHFGFQHERNRLEDNRYQYEGCLEPKHVFCEGAFASALDFLDSFDRKTGLYMNVGTMEVHMSEWGNMNNHGRRDLYGKSALGDVFLPPHMPDSKSIREAFQYFQGCISYFDHSIGEFLEGLKQRGLYDRAVIVITTDHGISGLRAKGTLYDAGMEVFQCIRLPDGHRAGERESALMPNVDLGVTLLDLANIEIPEDMTGKSFKGLLEGSSHYVRSDMIFTERNFHSSYDPMRAVRSDRYHYIRNFDDSALWNWLPEQVPSLGTDYKNYMNEMWEPFAESRPKVELYDLHTDPFEKQNLAGSSDHVAIASGLDAALNKWMLETDDFLISGEIPQPACG